MEKNIRRCKNSGVTLIALIITIIVMLILMTVIIVGVEQEGLFQIADKVAYDANAEIEAGYKLSGGSVEIEGVTYNSLQEYLDITSNNFTYSVSDITEEDIAPTDLFNYEIINNGAIGAISPLSSLPTKTARITGIKPEYCNIRGYNPETNLSGLTNTNYEIVYNGETISDTLIIPYQVDIEGELYKITEVCLTVAYNEQNIYASMPYIHTIIYPNTVEKIYTPEGAKIHGYNKGEYISILTDVILPNSLTSIGKGTFYSSKITSIVIPSSVTSIADDTFSDCSSLSSIVIPPSVTSIGGAAFYGCSSLSSIVIPPSVTTIGGRAFASCNSLTTVNYRGTQAQWRAISIGPSNTALTGATINYNYTGE